MRFKKLDLNLLVALDHMLNLKSVSRAAEQMNMSQSAMSNALTRLRDYFDDPILMQVGRQMELTARAEAMRDAVRDILVRVEATVSIDPAFVAKDSTREFRILLSDYTMAVLMPHVLALAYEQSPTVRFCLMPQVEHPYLAIERGDADVLIAPPVFCSPDHPSEMLFRDHFSGIFWNRGRFAGRPLTYDDYISAGHVRMMPPNNTTSFESQFLEMRGIHRRIDVTTYSFSALANLVIGTDRIATVHGLLARQALHHMPVEMIALPFENDPLDQTMQWHGYRSQDPGIVWLTDLFHQAVARMRAELI